MLIRTITAGVLLGAVTTAIAGFTLDPSIRPRLDGRYVLPAPFDREDAAIDVGALGRAATSTKAGKMRKLVQKAARQLSALQRQVRKRTETSAACRATLDAMMVARRQQVIALSAP
jgi:hypothetical protein